MAGFACYNLKYTHSSDDRPSAALAISASFGSQPGRPSSSGLLSALTPCFLLSGRVSPGPSGARSWSSCARIASNFSHGEFDAFDIRRWRGLQLAFVSVLLGVLYLLSVLRTKRGSNLAWVRALWREEAAASSSWFPCSRRESCATGSWGYCC